MLVGVEKINVILFIIRPKFTQQANQVNIN